jgi:mRNA interferase HigB
VWIVSERKLRESAERFPRARSPLRSWKTAVKSLSWTDPADMRRNFRTADFVGDKTIFDLGGNKFRLIAFVHYSRQIVFVKRILTHAEYDKGDWK